MNQNHNIWSDLLYYSKPSKWSSVRRENDLLPDLQVWFFYFGPSISHNLNAIKNYKAFSKRFINCYVYLLYQYHHLEQLQPWETLEVVKKTITVETVLRGRSSTLTSCKLQSLWPFKALSKSSTILKGIFRSLQYSWTGCLKLSLRFIQAFFFLIWFFF